MGRQGAFGGKVKIKISSAMTAIAHVEDFDYPELEKKLAEATAHDSPGGYAEHIATGERSVGEATLEITWDKSAATHAAIITAFNSSDPVDMSFEDPSGTEIMAVSAHIHKLGRIVKRGEAYKCKVGVQPTGQPTFTP